jgi:uncharacterized membrane protein YdbT with pleckstrin-like domain
MSFRQDQLLPGEAVLVLAHPHALVLLRPVLLNLASALLLAGVSYASGLLWPLILDIAPLAYLLWEILERNGREYIVTNRRVVKQEGVFSVSSFDAPLDKINNIFHEQSALGRILGFGDVGLETASEQGTTMFRKIPDPIGFKNLIVEQRELYKSVASPAQSRNSKDDIPRLLDDLARLRDRNVITDAEFEAKKKSLLEKL